LVRLACCAGTRDFCSALAALVSPVQNIFFLTVYDYNSFVPIAQQAGQAVALGRLSLVYVSLVFTHKRSEANFIVPDLGGRGIIVDSDRGLSYRPASLCSLAGRYNSCLPESTIYLQSGTKNLATAVWAFLLLRSLWSFSEHPSLCRLEYHS
jgi:hypothetical protein